MRVKHVITWIPWCATDPRDLFRAWELGMDVLYSTENLVAFRIAGRLTSNFIAAWGAHVRPWMKPAIDAFLAESARPVLCFGKTREGHPRHPLMLRSDTPLEEYI